MRVVTVTSSQSWCGIDMKTLLTSIVALLFAIPISWAQPGPGPTPSGWTISGSTINPNGLKVVTAPSKTGIAGFNVPPGVAPTSPVNGDMWSTSAGFFVRSNGITAGPLASSTASGFAATAPLSVSFPAGVVTYALGIDANFSVVSSNLALAAGGIAYPAGVTGGQKGAGTINATGLYVSNVAVVAGGISSLTTDVSAAGPGAAIATIQPGVVTYAKIQNLGALAIMGRSANSSGVGADIQATAASGAVLRESGSVIGFGQIATAGIADNAVTLAKLAPQATNTLLGNATAGSAVPTALAIGSCGTASSAVQWTTNTGFGCNTSITAAAVPASGLTGTTLASNVVTSSITTVGALAGGSATTGFTINAANVTVSSQFPGTAVATAANASGSPSATFGVVKCDGTTITCASGVISSTGGSASAVTIGTTSVISGASGNLISNSSNLLAEVTPGNGVAIIGSTLGLTAARRTLPTTQNFTSGTGATYTTPANALWIEVWACGGGGGGAGAESGTNTIVGTAGTTTTFNSVNAVGGSGGSASTGGNSTPLGGAGGTGGTGTTTVRMAGNAGQNGSNNSTIVMPSGAGGGSPLFGGSTPGKTTTAAGNAGIAGSGAGGAGAINLSGANNTSGAGGGSGECFYLNINSPSATYTYTVGPGGAGGVSTSNGGAGANGQILVKEHYGT